MKKKNPYVKTLKKLKKLLIKLLIQFNIRKK